MDIRIDFGQRIKELRTRAGMSQEILAHYSELDRSYISSIESGNRNISILNIAKIADALKVSIPYLFSNERFSIHPAYQQQDFKIPFANRFHYYLDHEKKILALQVKGLLNGYEDCNYLSSVVMGICSAFGKGGLHLFVDHRFMVSSDGQPAVYSPEVLLKNLELQQKVLAYCNKVVVLCPLKRHFFLQRVP
ncbi:helix-turn-helix transcriptional regulator [Paenibacillus sp. GSMTC-2017]|uniref:helix-turn-helix domain-containing protein n=1 Tax=Paenibacillus sp. GSMTC-2017 TaxID=2794350 RepID=UPI0018D67C17|nr:helix-turn-helix transcriptional regulator [Paenibacillus sp. GSMTC-2017]MBH5318386.1 helix-turn-helix transcriptional regulator [Paenibacillus sp. GSMTC-2017]